MMRFNNKSSFSPETPKSYWNCYMPYNTGKELFLSNHLNSHRKRIQQGSFQHTRKESEITYNAPPKVSLKNKRDSKLNHTLRMIKEDSSIGNFNQTPSTLIPTMRPLLGNHSQPCLILEGRSPTSQMPSKVQFQSTQPQIVVTPAFIKFAKLNPPPPALQLSNIPLQNQPKQREVPQQQQNNESTNRKIPTWQTVNDVCQSQSFRAIEKEKEGRLQKYRAQLKIPEISYKIKELQNRKTKEASHNPEPELLSPLEPKQTTSKSLMTQNKVYPSKQRQDIWSMTEPVRSFCSQKNIRKPRIQRMSEVEEIKSQPDSDQNSNVSDNQSIVLGRLEELQSFFNSKQLQGSSIPYSKLNPSNSSTLIRDTS